MKAKRRVMQTQPPLAHGGRPFKGCCREQDLWGSWVSHSSHRFAKGCRRQGKGWVEESKGEEVMSVLAVLI